MSSLLIVEDEQIVALSLKIELESLGYEIVGIANSEDEALALFTEKNPDLVLMDINLESGGSGINAAKKINTIKNIPIIYVTAYANDDIIESANSANPIGYIVKPYNLREVRAVIETALNRFRYEDEITSSEARLKLAIEAANLNVWEYNPEAEHLVFTGTEMLQKYFGHLSPLPFNEFISMVHEQDKWKVESLLKEGQKSNQKIRIKSPLSDEQYWFEVYTSDIKLQGGDTPIGAMKDVTETETYIRELKVSKSVFSHIADGILVLNKDCEITKANPAFCKLIGYPLSQLINKNYHAIVKRERAEDINQQPWEDLCSRREETFKTESGELFYALVNGKLISHQDQSDELVMIVTDISELKMAERKLQYQAYRDELTGMYNRTYMNRAFANPQEFFDSGKFTLMFIDLDSFKLINDTYGHSYGDVILAEFAWRLKHIFRSSDIMIRHGGDEFVLMLDGQLTANDISKIANSINKAISEPFKCKDVSISLTCSIGIAQWDDTISDTSDLMKRADIAMYAAKNGGKNDFRFYQEDMGSSAQYQLFLEQGLKLAIENELLELWLQPIFDNKGEISSAEGLCRWRDKATGFISPNDFIPIAESSWLIFPLGELMLKKVCDAIEHLSNAGFTDIKLGLNLSAKQLSHPSLPAKFEEIISSKQVSPNNITLEITETALTDTPAIKNIERLREIGFSIALDDFGRGYSSLELLQQFDLDILKIDRVFIEGIPDDSKARKVCEHMVNLSKSLGYKVVVEGIESAKQSEYFAQDPAIHQQGFYHAKPMPVSLFLSLLGGQSHSAPEQHFAVDEQ